MDIAALIRQLDDPDPLARMLAGGDLADAGSAAVEPLIAALASPSVETRWRAAAALGWLGDPAAVPALAARLTADGYDVQINAAWALGQIGNVRAAPALLAVVSAPGDADPDVRYVSALALSRLGADAALEGALAAGSPAAFRAAHAARAARRLAPAS